MKVNNPKISKNQIGFVSIVVTVIIMIVISLIVIAFSKLVRRDQRQALDRQLNTQAFYAAEAGVNSALKAVKAGYNQEKNNCNDSTDPLYSAPYNVNPIIDASTSVKVSCLLIDPFVTTLEYDNVDTSESTVVPVKLRDASTTISSITLSWQDTNGSTSFDCPWGAGAAPELPPVSGWSCSTGVMRMDMVPFTGTQDRQALSEAMFTRFLYPSSAAGGNTTGYTALSQPDAYRVLCNAASVRYCSVEFTGLSSNTVYLRLKSIYKASAVTITCTQANSLPCELTGAQVMIDATGKAKDVIKRIQVRSPVNNNKYLLPEGPITTRDDICKRYVVQNDTSLIDTDSSCGFN